MPIKDKGLTVMVFAEDVANGGGKTGDSANITLRKVSDGTDGAIAGSVSEVSATNHPGLYSVTLTGGENNGDMMYVGGKSSSTDVVVTGCQWTNEVNVSAINEDEQSATDLKDFADAGYDPDTNKVQGVVLVDTTTANTDMRGTDSAALAVNYTAARAGYLDNINGHTAQTGDNYARIGANGSGLSAIPWNASWDAEVQSECNDALVALGLDHLLSVAVVGADVTDNSIIARLVSKSSTADWDSFDHTSDSLEAIADGAGGGGPSAASIADAVWNELQADHTTVGSFGEIATEIATLLTDLATVDTNVDAVLEDTGTTLPGTLSGIESKIDTVDSVADAILVDTGTTLPGTLTTIEGKVDTVDGVVDTILVDTNEIQGDLTDGGRLDLILDSINSAWTTALTESYASDGAAMTPAQALHMIYALVGNVVTTGINYQAKRLDGSTNAMVFTMDDATNPTQKIRAS